jgi:hypothetical protein
MKKLLTQIEVTFEDSPVIEIEPVTRVVRAGREKRSSVWGWLGL